MPSHDVQALVGVAKPPPAPIGPADQFGGGVALAILITAIVIFIKGSGKK